MSDIRCPRCDRELWSLLRGALEALGGKRVWAEMVDTGPGYVTAIFTEGQDDADIYEWDYDRGELSDKVRIGLDGPFWLVPAGEDRYER